MSDKKTMELNEKEEQELLNQMTLTQRGETSPDLIDECLQLCQQFLGGIWIKRSVDDIQVTRVTGGMTNQLFVCKINEQNEDNCEPQEVLIRLYGKKFKTYLTFDENNPRFNDTIISLIMSDNKIGPKVYGLSESGQILHFYKNRRFNINDLNNEEYVDQLSAHLARIHSLNPPIDRDRNWIMDSFNNYKESIDDYFITTQKILFETLNCNELMDFDFKAEFDWIIDCIENTDSKTVFCHNDFSFHNILVTESDGIVLCDFEYSYYGYRGWDLGFLFTYDVPEDLMKKFIVKYVNNCEKLLGKQYSNDPNNSVQHILKESKLFLMFALMFIAFDFLTNDPTSGKPIDKNTAMFISMHTLKKYVSFKKEWINEGNGP